MSRIYTYIFLIFLTIALATVLTASAFAGSSAGKANQYETVEGVLSIKEGHGDFLVRMLGGKVQHFSVRGKAAKITRNGKPARYSDLKPSDSIQVQYDVSNREVISIHASGP